MTKQIIYSSAMLALLATSFASCSSDDVIDGGNVWSRLNPISMTVSADEEGSQSTVTRTGIVFTGGTSISGTQNVWEKNDVVWAYSTSKNYFNKLVSISNSADKYHETELNFSSGSNEVNYEANERLILFNCGDNTGNTNLTTSASDGTNIKLTRATDDNLMACVYGDGSTVPAYTDESNAFSLRRVSAVIKDDGKLYKKTDAKSASVSSLQNTYTKLYFSIPALDKADAEKLSQLTYKIVVKVADNDENSGYPQTVSFKLDNTLGTKNNEKVFDENAGAVTTWGKQLQVKFTPDGKDARHKSSSLWNTTSGADDENQGMVFFFLPPNVYKSISVKVRIEAPENVTIDDDIKALCKTYSFTFAPEDEDEYYDNSGVNAKSSTGFMTEKLGAIWNRTSNGAKPAGFLARSSASTGWVVADND